MMYGKQKSEIDISLGPRQDTYALIQAHISSSLLIHYLCGLIFGSTASTICAVEEDRRSNAGTFTNIWSLLLHCRQ